ncbi:hypothetical protein PFISCL1PPCAC_1938, partial [Pristionchus fissidentatus]
LSRMPPAKRGLPPDGKPRRTFPTKAKPGSSGGLFKVKGTPNSTRNHHTAQKEMKKEDTNVHKKDEMMRIILIKRKWEESDEMRMMIYRKSYLLLHGIAKVQKSELVWENEHKGPLFFSKVHLKKLKVEMKATHADTQSDSHMLAAYSYFKYLIATCGLLPSASLFYHLIVLSTESELGQMAIHMTPLIDSFVSIFGSSIGNQGRSGMCNKRRTSFDESQAVVVANLNSLLSRYGERKPVIRNSKDIVSSLAEVYCEIESNVREKKESSKGKKITFDSDEEEQIPSNVSEAGATVNGVEKEDEEDVKPVKKVKREIKEESDEEAKVKTKKKKKMKEEENESDDEKEREKSEEREKKRKKEKRKKNESECSNTNGWGYDSEVEEAEERVNISMSSTYSESTSNEFRSNLRELASETWKKNVELYGIETEPSVVERAKMARFIINHLEEKYGDELLEILQYFTSQSFSPSDLKKKEEWIGLVLYLDQRRLIGETFLFLIMASNDENVARSALDGSELCFKTQYDAAMIGRSVSLGKPLHKQLAEANREANVQRKSLENNMYHIFFPQFVQKGTMKKISESKIEKSKGEKAEVVKNTAFTHEFWIKSSKLFNLESDWSTYEVNASACRVFAILNLMFEEKLLHLIQVMSARRVTLSGFSDPSSGQALNALYRMKSTGFFTDSLLFVLLRLPGEKAIEKSLQKLSQLCIGFTKVVETGAKSKSLKTDQHFKSLKEEFGESAKKINTQCLQFYESLINSKGRKRCLSSSSTVGRSGGGEEREESNRKKKRKKEDGDEEKKEKEESQAMEIDLRRVKMEEEEEKKKEEKKKEKEKDAIEVDMRRVKVEGEEKRRNEKTKKKVKEEEEDEENGKTEKKKKLCGEVEEESQAMEVDLTRVKMEEE